MISYKYGTNTSRSIQDQTKVSKEVKGTTDLIYPKTLATPTNRNMPIVSGSAMFFFVSSLAQGCLECEVVKDIHFGPEDIVTIIPRSIKSGPLFAECRNFKDSPSGCHGMACSFVLTSDTKKWRLGYIN